MLFLDGEPWKTLHRLAEKRRVADCGTGESAAAVLRPRRKSYGLQIADLSIAATAVQTRLRSGPACASTTR